MEDNKKEYHRNIYKTSIRILIKIVIGLISIYLLFPLLKGLYNYSVLINKLVLLIFLIQSSFYTFFFQYIKVTKAYDKIKWNLNEYLSSLIANIKKMKVIDKVIMFILFIILFFIAFFLISFFYHKLNLIFTIIKIIFFLYDLIFVIFAIILYYTFNYNNFTNNLNIFKYYFGIYIEVIFENIKDTDKREKILMGSLVAFIPSLFIFVILPTTKFMIFISNFIINFLLIISLFIFSFIHYLANDEKFNKTAFILKMYCMKYIKDIKEFIKDTILNITDNSLRNAKKLVKSCLSEEESFKYKKFTNVIINFKRKDFFKIFEGDLNINDDKEIEDLCNKYKIDDKESFKFLVLKFINFQLIFGEWYEDESKHEYLKNLWLLYPTMYKLNDLSEEDLELKLEKINFSKWNDNDKITLKQCIANSPEIKAIQFSTFINNNYEEFNSLIINAMKYKETFKEYENMELYENKCYTFIKKFVKTGFEMKGKIVDPLNKFQNAIENRTIECFINNCTQIIKTNKNYNFYFNSIINSFKNEKVMNIFNSNAQILPVTNLAFSFLELSHNVIGLIDCFKELINLENDVFKFELNKINENFKNHKNRISLISGNDGDDSKLILSILSEIQKDHNDIIQLIEKINDKKKYQEMEAKQSRYKLIKNTLTTICGLTLSTIFSGGIAGAVGLFVGVTGIIKSSAEVYVNYQKLKCYKELLEETENKKDEIENEIKNIKNLYFKITSAHCPEEMKDKIIGEYLNK